MNFRGEGGHFELGWPYARTGGDDGRGGTRMYR